MGQRLSGIVAILALTMLATPATAKTWVQDDGGYWVDRDSIRRDGAIRYFVLTWVDGGRYPSDTDAGVLYAYDCNNELLYGVRNGQLVAPGFSSQPDRVSPATAARYSTLLCS